MKLGFLGLGKMGSRMAGKLVDAGNELIVWNRSTEPVEKFQNQHGGKKFSVAESIEKLAKELPSPKIIWLMLPAGEVTENILAEVIKYVSAKDIVIDGGNANYNDTQRRFEVFKDKNIKFLGIGVSGGLLAASNGYPLMVGGDRSAYEYISPILDSLASPNGLHKYLGAGGAGHFVKMVHNGIEYGMMQAIGEGFGVLAKSNYNYQLNEVAEVWQKGTIISGFLMDRSKDLLERNPTLSGINGIIAESGEAKWTVETAKKEKVPITVIDESLEFRKKSQTDLEIQNSTAAKVVAALRGEFGGHEIEKK